MDATRAARWDDLRLLLAVVRRGSFAAAGRELGIATSTLSRRLQQLESAVGAPLLERRADGARLTDAGRRLAATAEEVELALHARMRELPADAAGLSGTIRVTAGDGFADVLVDAVASFRAQHPGVYFELSLDNRALDLPRREADVALRTVHGREGTLIYRALEPLAYGLFASTAYAARRGLPRGVRDLARHDFLGLSAPGDRTPWMRWLARHGATRFALRSASFVALLAAARAGLGIAALPQRLGGDLVRVVARARPDPLPLWVALHRDARRQPAVRAFADHLVSALRGLEARL